MLTFKKLIIFHFKIKEKAYNYYSILLQAFLVTLGTGI